MHFREYIGNATSTACAPTVGIVGMGKASPIIAKLNKTSLRHGKHNSNNELSHLYF